MTAIHETAYPRLKPNPDNQELKQNFLPSKAEHELLNKSTSEKSPHSRLGFMLSLKCYQCLGYHIPINTIPKPIIEYIANCIEIKVDKVKLQNYMQLKQRKRHKIVIRKFLAINECKQQRKSIMKSAGLKSAAIKESLADIINDMLEELIKNNFEIPAFSTLLRLARAARTIVSSVLYQRVSDQLTDETKQFFDQLLLSTSPVHEFTSGWEYLKQEMKKPSVTNIREFTDYLDQLRKWRDESPIDLSDIPEHRLDQYVAEAMALDIADMRRIKEAKRYALSAMLLYHQYAKSLDNIVTVLARWLRKIKNDAAEALQEIRNSSQKITDQLIGSLKQVLVASKQTAQTPEEKLGLIEQSLPNDIDASIEACEQYLAYADDNDLPLMLKYYQVKRHTMFRLLKQIEIKSASKDVLVEKLVEFILAHQRSHGEYIEINPEEFGNLEWLDDQWFQFITEGKTKRYTNQIRTVKKQKLELAIFRFAMDEINCADAFALNSYENDDPNKQFIPWDEFYQSLKPYAELIGKSDDPRLFVKELQVEHQQAAEKVNQNFVDNEYLNIINGEPVLKRAISKKVSQQQEKFSNLVASKMPLTDIVSVLTDVENWLGISRHLKPLSGYEPKIDDYDLRFIATSFAYGCNVGPVQAERCLKKYSRKQIAWLFNHHITELRLNKINEVIIKAYKQFELPYIWGNGESASVDGTYWDMYTNNLLAEHHIRYGKYGGIGYYHVSDQYVALFGNFIPCGVYEAMYIFDGIYESDETLRPDTIHGDTHAQNEVVFGFAYLLAITLMPRIRSFKHLNFYRPAEMNEKSYQHINDIFTSKEPNWQLIESMYYDMLRVVMSIQSGKIKASTILKKLRSNSKKNKLHQAFRELGRVVRTIFLLKYIADVDLRKKIQAATCKSEEFNDFIDWITFGKDGVIHENNSIIQQKIIAFGRMVANAVMFYTVANTTKVLNQLSAEEVKYSQDDLSILSAYFRENINRYGVFDLSRSRQTMPLQFGINRD
ncbi:TPA: Tn3 family transposase [Legionella pneumophila]|nr:Tn3 family transposase [Legionella pneumophila]HAU1619900.1 Tn3 family transposase [Legionella pneumophila]